MKLPKELYNGIIIVIGIGLYFLLMEALHIVQSSLLWKIAYVLHVFGL